MRDYLDAECYPVYESLVDDRGRLIHANDLAPLVDTLTLITVESEP